MDPGIAQAERQVTITRYQEDEARAGLMPRLTGRASKEWIEQDDTITIGATPQDRSLSYDQTSYGITLTQPLFSGGRTWVAMDIADQAQQRAQAALSSARQQLIVQVAEAYFGVLDAKEEVELARRDTLEKDFISRDGIDEHIAQTLEEIQSNLYDVALKRMQDHTYVVDDYEEFKEAMKESRGFVWAHWDGTPETEAQIKEETKATIRVIPLDDNKGEPGKCIVTGKPSEQRVLFARAY